MEQAGNCWEVTGGRVRFPEKEEPCGGTKNSSFPKPSGPGSERKTKRMAQWNPWQALDALRREIDQSFERTGLQLPPPFRTAFLPGRAAREYPLINLHEDKDTVYVED